MPEDREVGVVLLTVIATDTDKGETTLYSMGTTVSEFFVEASTGNIILLKSLDRELTDRYEQTIQATDGENIATATVTITVSDINDNTPKFEPASYR